MQGNVTHIEIGASTSSLSPTFFTHLFGWPYSAIGQGGGVFNTPSCKVGLHANDPTPSMVVYFSVENIEHAATKVRELGGHAGDVSPVEPGFGRFCSCKDPEGIVFGLHQPASPG